MWPGSYLARSEAMSKGQAERLLPMIQDLMVEAQIAWTDLDRIAVGTGPGNFTGIRIGVALARGLSLGLGIPAVGVTGFQARANSVSLDDYWVTIPAPRDQIYAQRFGTASSPATMSAAASFNAAAVGVLSITELSPQELVCAIADVASSATDFTRPAPFYLRAADALPSSDPPPMILP